MNAHEAKLLNEMSSGLDSFDSHFDTDDADGQLKPGFGGGAGIPRYVSQFDITQSLIFYDVTTSALTLPAALPAPLQSQLPAFIFGNIDSAAGYPAGFSKLPIPAPWVFTGIVTIGIGETPAPIAANVSQGDLVITYQGVSGNTYNAYVIIHSPQVPYSSFLAALQSDKFVMNYVRLNVFNAAIITQFNNQLFLVKQTLFGKTSADSVSPTAHINPMNQQAYIVDVPLSYGIDKNRSFAYYCNYDVPVLNYSIFVATKTLIKAQG
jgi:hypothetical protein